MTTLLAIDPGKCTGWALFDGATLLVCGVTSIEEERCTASTLLRNGEVDEFVIELPQIYRASLSKGDPNDLIKVAVEVGGWKERARARKGVAVSTPKPLTWKGNVPKPVHHARCLAVLSEAERVASGPVAKKNTQRENMWDAIALGLWKRGRIP